MTRVTIAALSVLALVACGGGDTATPTSAAVTTTDAPASTAAPPDATGMTGDPGDPGDTGGTGATDETGGDGPVDTDPAGDRAVVGSISELPAACRDTLTTFLRDIEPIVADIEWETITIDELSGSLDEPAINAIGAQYDADMAAQGCPDLDPTANLDDLMAFAAEVAPGSAGYLEFISLLRAPGEGTADSYASCDEVLGFFEELLATHESMTAMPAIEVGTVTGAMTALPEHCTNEKVTEFYSRDDVIAFLEG